LRSTNSGGAERYASARSAAAGVAIAVELVAMYVEQRDALLQDEPRAALSVACPSCRAMPDVWCHFVGREPKFEERDRLHVSRIAARMPRWRTL
jgi:hypothetical protein